ncbi:polyprotein [Washington bat picornavirus]|uniref:polyprotein n=1 Tax=Washington bat picornavirus TaxID=1888309 RepID=UPI00083F49D5|nr:polyprotein [Washington bat picornavirus]AOC55055.1 polyprotein [Washington bat picornavirus]
MAPVFGGKLFLNLNMATTQGNQTYDREAPSAIYEPAENKPAPTMSEDLVIEFEHRGRLMRSRIVGTASLIYHLPLDGEEVDMFLKTYQSPFFDKLYERVIVAVGVKNFRRIVNEYLCTSQYRRGEMSYYNDQVFGTRRRRDAFKAHLEKYLPKEEDEVAQAESLQEDGSTVSIIGGNQFYTRKDLREARDSTKRFVVTCVYEALSSWPKERQLAFKSWFARKMNEKHMEVQKRMPFEHWAFHENETCYNAMLSWMNSKKNREQKKEETPVAESAGEESNVDQQQNTTFTDQREIVRDQGYVTSQELSNLKEYSMPEDEWHVRNIMAKPIPFYTGDWSTGTATGTIVQRWNVPGDTLFGPHYNMVSTFTYFRGHPKIRVQVNGTKFHAGRLIFAFIPLYDHANYEDKLYSISSMTALPHVILDAGIANSGELTLPFVHLNTYFNSVSGDRPWQTLGTLVCAVYNRLRAATTSSQTVGVTAWISFDNCELHQPCFAHDVTFPKYNKDKRDKLETPQAESLVEGVLKSALPLVKDLITPEMTSFGNVLGGAADQDKPTDPVEITRWVPNVVSGLTKGDGIDRCERLCLKAGGYTIPDADLISTTQDDMNLLQLMKIPTRLQLTSWSSTTTSGTRIAHIPVAPFVIEGQEVDSSIVPPVDIFRPTMLSYVSRAFKYWRGGLRYKIQIIASQMHTGRLMVSFGAGLEVGAKEFSKASYLNTYVIDLQEMHEVEFVVPFMAERPWLRCDVTKPVSGKFSAQNFSHTGWLDIFILNKLAHPESVSSDVEVNVMISAADDFEVAFPSDFAYYQGSGSPISIAFSETAQAESLVEQEAVTTRQDEGVITLGKGTGRLTAAGPTTMGEDAMSLKTLLRRYTKAYHNHHGVANEYKIITFDNTPVLSSVNKCFNKQQGRQYRTTLAHFSELFTFWRGSLRYKMVYKVAASDGNTPALTLRVFHIPGVFNFGTFTPAAVSLPKKTTMEALEAYGTQVAVSELQGSMEFEIPFYTPYTQLKTFHSGIPNARSATGKVVCVLESPISMSEVHINLDLYQAAGDDFTLNYLRSPPKMQFVADADDNRDTDDTAAWLFPDKVVCGDNAAPEHETPQAEGLMDYIPGVSHVRATASKVDIAADKMITVSDTANHVMLQAAKKLGIEALSEEEEEEGATTMFEDASSALAKLSSPLMPIIETLLASLKTLPDSLSKFVRQDISAMDVFIEISNLFSGLTAFQHGTHFVQKVCAIVTIVSTIVKDITSRIRNSLYRFAATVLEYFNGSKEGNALPEGESLSIDLVAPLAASMVVGMGIIGFKHIPSDKETADMCKGMSEKLRLFNFSTLAVTNVRKLWNEVKELTQWCMDWLMEKLQPQLLAQLKLEREFEDIETWTLFIDSLEKLPYTDMIHYDIEFKNKVFRAIDQGVKYNNLIVTGKCGKAASIIRSYCMKAHEIGVKCENSKNELPYRIDPYCICMFGTSNIGKSGCITTLGYDIMDTLGYPLHNRWCAINCSETFFSENYRQQCAVYFDDFSTFTTEEQYNKFMNLKANTALPLNMAFKKGEYFNSQFIFMTTNTPYPQPNFVTNHEALLRRRDKLIEADWIEDPVIQAALDNGENMSEHRKLDNSHLRFRVVHSVDDTKTPGPWMNYAMLRAHLTGEARHHLAIQQRKVTADLERAGYIMPVAEAAEVRRLCLPAIANAPSLKLLEPMLWKHMEWDSEEEKFSLFLKDAEEDAEYLEEQWNDAQQFFTDMGLDIQTVLKNHSYVVKDTTPLLTKIRGSLNELKEWLKKTVTKICEDHPWIATIAKWGIYIAGALAAANILFNFSKKVIHKCACSVIRYFGFRCGLCGKWPALKNVGHRWQQWIIKEWSKLYGNEDYTDGHVTTIAEEQALKAATGDQTTVVDYELGTKKQAEAEGVYSDVTKGMRPIRVTAQSGPYSQDTKGAPKLKLTAESQAEQAETIISHRILKYIYRFKTKGGVGISSQQTNGFAIGQRKVLVNSHLLYGLKDGDLIETFHNGRWIEFEFHEEICKRVPNKDLVIIEMPKSFHAHKSNLPHFISEKDLPYVQNVEGSLCKMTTGLDHLIVDNLRVKPMKQVRFEQNTLGGKVPYFVQDAWKYQKCTQFGDCGSPLICTSGPAAGRILGIHIASTSKESYAQLITREMLSGLLDAQLGTPIPEAEARLGHTVPDGHFGRIGCAGVKERMFQSDKTEIIETEIHAMITPPETFPTVLSKRDPRLTVKVDPLKQGISKYAGVSKPFPLRHRKIVNEMMQEEVKLLDLVRENPRPTTWEQACYGDEWIEGFERLPKNTSPGFPWVKTRPAGEAGKEYLFDIENQRMRRELETAVLQREEMAKKNERVLSIWVDCLKDERRKLKKIETGNTRIFTIPPVDFSIVLRKYTMDFNAAIWNSRDTNDCKVGIDPQSLEWTTLYRWLAEFSPICVAGDFSNFDGNMPAEIIDDVRGDIDAFYEFHGECSEEDKNVRRVCFEEMIHTVHLARDEYYMTHIGNKSGNPITVILNSRVNKRYMALAWIGIAEEKGLWDFASMQKFRDNVRCAIYGDDNVLAIKPEVLEWFNQETISEYLAKYNITYTNEEKSGITKFKNLDDCTFLKQRFSDHTEIKMIKVPLMAKTTINELLNWTRVAPDQDELLASNCNDALRFMYFYGKNEFNMFRDKVLRALLEKEKKIVLRTYTDLHLWFLGVIGAREKQ